jgi:hypothetical protein
VGHGFRVLGAVDVITAVRWRSDAMQSGSKYNVGEKPAAFIFRSDLGLSGQRLRITVGSVVHRVGTSERKNVLRNVAILDLTVR